MTWVRIDELLPGDLVLWGGERVPTQVTAIGNAGDEMVISTADGVSVDQHIARWVVVQRVERETRWEYEDRA